MTDTERALLQREWTRSGDFACRSDFIKFVINVYSASHGGPVIFVDGKT